MGLKECKKRLEQGAKEDPLTLKAKKDKMIEFKLQK